MTNPCKPDSEHLRVHETIVDTSEKTKEEGSRYVACEHKNCPYLKMKKYKKKKWNTYNLLNFYKNSEPDPMQKVGYMLDEMEMIMGHISCQKCGSYDLTVDDEVLDKLKYLKNK